MILRDGAGSFRGARVNTYNRLEVHAVTEADSRRSARLGQTWSVTASSTPVGTNDYIFYFKNTSGTETYVLSDIRIIASAVTFLTVDYVSGTPTFAAGVDLTPVNRNLGLADTMTATIKQDTNTTGLTDKGLLFPMLAEGAGKQHHMKSRANVFIPPGQAVAMASSVATNVTSVWTFSLMEDT